MILLVETQNGVESFKIKNSLDAVEILRKLTHAGRTCYRLEVMKCS